MTLQEMIDLVSLRIADRDHSKVSAKLLVTLFRESYQQLNIEHKLLLKRGTGIAADGAVELPADFFSLVRVRVPASFVVGDLRDMPLGESELSTRLGYISGNSIITGAIDDTDFEIDYVSKGLNLTIGTVGDDDAASPEWTAYHEVLWKTVLLKLGVPYPAFELDVSGLAQLTRELARSQRSINQSIPRFADSQLRAKFSKKTGACGYSLIPVTATSDSQTGSTTDGPITS